MTYNPRPSTLSKRPSPAKRPATVNGRPLSVNLRPTGLIDFKAVAAAAGGTVLSSVQSDLGVTLNSTTVSAWADQSGAGKDYSQGVAANQPTYAAGAVNGFPSITFDGVNDELNSVLDLPAPATTPYLIYGVIKQITWVNTRGIWGTTGAGTLGALLSQQTATPALWMYNGTANANPSTGATIGSYARVGVQYTGSTSDYVKAGSAAVSTGASSGNADAAATFSIGRYGTTAVNGNFAILMLMVLSGTYASNGAVFTALDNAVATKYGGVVLI